MARAADARRKKRSRLQSFSSASAPADRTNRERGTETKMKWLCTPKAVACSSSQTAGKPKSSSATRRPQAVRTRASSRFCSAHTSQASRDSNRKKAEVPNRYSQESPLAEPKRFQRCASTMSPAAPLAATPRSRRAAALGVSTANTPATRSPKRTPT